MVKNIYSLFTILFFLGASSFNVNAVGSNIGELSNIPLQGLKTIAVEVITPTGGDYRDLQQRGVTKEKLEENVNKQLQAAGFNIYFLNISTSKSETESVSGSKCDTKFLCRYLDWGC
jgi:hypothetical protein